MKRTIVLISILTTLLTLFFQVATPIKSNAEDNKAKEWRFYYCGTFAGVKMYEAKCERFPVPSCNDAPCGIWLPPVIID